MKTPILDERIRDLENLESLDEMSEFGEKMLSEFKAIKQALNLDHVSVSACYFSGCLSQFKGECLNGRAWKHCKHRQAER